MVAAVEPVLPASDGWLRMALRSDDMSNAFDDPVAPAARTTWARDAALIARYLDALAEHGAWAEESVVNIVDLAPADGERGWQILRLLASAAPSVRYVAVCATQEQVVALRAHPALLGPSLAWRWTAVCQPTTTEGWRFVLGETRNPTVILAHDFFAKQRHDLYACHYGAWLQARVEGELEGEVRAAWCGEGERHALAAQLASHYLAGMNSGALLLPTGAVDRLTPLIEAGDGRYLLLSSDVGVGRLADIRLGALSVAPERLLGAERLPVNYHALALWQQAAGAHATNLGDGLDDNLVWQLGVRDDAHPDVIDCLPALEAAWKRALPVDDCLHALAAQIAGQLDARQAFALWRAAGHSPALLLTLADALIAAAGSAEAEALPAWRDALADACQQHFTPPRDDGFLHVAARLAIALDAWGMARCAIEEAWAVYGASVEDLRLLALCRQRCGLSHEALACLELALLEFGEDAELRAEHDALNRRLSRWRALPGYSDDIVVDGALSLEPLGLEHLPAFRYQYRDPQIGMMTRLPAFADEAELATWIGARAAEPNRTDFAIMHRAYGFAGVISAHRIGESAFFHFWIGTDFQGQGLALPAVRGLCAHLRRIGVQRVFTTVYPDNARSLRTLARAGFVALQARALPPEEAMPFFCLELHDSTASSLSSLGALLREYCSRSGGVFEFADRQPILSMEASNG